MGGGRLEKGVCQCNELQEVDGRCDKACRDKELRFCYNPRADQIQIHDPAEGTTVYVDANRISAGKPRCKIGDCCRFRMISIHGGTGAPVGRYNVGLKEILALLGDGTDASAVRAARRALLQTDAAAGIELPLVCLEHGESMVWDLTDLTGTLHYPTYDKDSLLNTNANFDYGPFRALAERLQSDAVTKTFIYAFTEAGTYVFSDSEDAAKKTIIRVVREHETCPTDGDNAPIMSISQTSLTNLGVAPTTDIILAPDWLLIGVLLMGVVLLVAGIVVGLWHFRRQTWGMVCDQTDRRACNRIVL